MAERRVTATLSKKVANTPSPPLGTPPQQKTEKETRNKTAHQERWGRRKPPPPPDPPKQVKQRLKLRHLRKIQIINSTNQIRNPGETRRDYHL